MTDTLAAIVYRRLQYGKSSRPNDTRHESGYSPSRGWDNFGKDISCSGDVELSTKKVSGTKKCC